MIQAGERADSEVPVNRIYITDSIVKKVCLFLNKYILSNNIISGVSLIAATEYCYDLYLLTQNIRHYPMPEIRVIKP